MPSYLPCKVNLIEYNPISLASYKNAQADKIDAFAKYLQKKGVNTTIRRSRGKDIDAACGQLAIQGNSKHPGSIVSNEESPSY